MRLSLAARSLHTPIHPRPHVAANSFIRRLHNTYVLHASLTTSATSTPYHPPSYLRAVSGGVSVFVHCRAGCSTSSIASATASHLQLRIGAEAIDGAANDELLRFLASALGVSKGSVSIVKGANSSRKLISVRTEQTVQQVEAVFNR